jgi:four helix bundle protein
MENPLFSLHTGDNLRSAADRLLKRAADGTTSEPRAKMSSASASMQVVGSAPVVGAAPGLLDWRLDFERADVYAFALDLHALVATLVSREGVGALRAEVARASLAVPLWVAEAGGRPPGLERRRFLLRARAAVTETAELLDRLRVRRLVAVDDHARARRLIVELVRTLTRLSSPPRERVAPLPAPAAETV